MLKLRLGFLDQPPSGAVEGFREPEHRRKTRIALAALNETDIGRVARRLRRQGFLRHSGLRPPAANDLAETARCDMRVHPATLGEATIVRNRQ